MFANGCQAFAGELRFISGGLQQFLAAWLGGIRLAPASTVKTAFASGGRTGTNTCHSVTYMPDGGERRVKILPLTRTTGVRGLAGSGFIWMQRAPENMIAIADDMVADTDNQWIWRTDDMRILVWIIQ